MDDSILVLILLAGFVGGFVDSAVGGGGLIRLPALLAAGLPSHVALATNKFGSTWAAGMSSAQYWRSGIVPKKEAFIGWGLMLIMSVFGALAVTKVSAEWVIILVFIVLLVMFLYVLFSREFGLEEDIQEDRILPVTIGMSTGLGFYDGFLGPGTGNFLLAGYVKAAGFDMKRAAATSKVVNFGGNLGALILFASVDLIDYTVGVPFAIVNIIGGLLGSTYALRYGTKLLRPLFLIISFFLISKIGYDILVL
ncbi:MAG: TSUP family transporter [Euryarchaeota archaeon]|jgi:hypothetical protein|nr:TSUP family transporter [Euryarchaeota archaeon]MBT3846638.1 TSUP family transporter [Euryarchaeota archaeon]MBT4156282.1 TSUP family transporter [Euryarchaeota archaeon]MBT4475356.1 TSUP family transporter [Euryarchaeota archaeon]MBT4793586.1 TSUP family transporter [Euryarchaeota archaeon]